jgi:peptide chain release factor 1
MYTKYCENRGWRTSVVDMNEGTSGGFKEVIFEVSEDVYGTLKFEAGVHRVQRVPQTETQGRVHTSAATVMVLQAEEFDVQIDMNDVSRFFLFFRTRWTIGKYNKISRSFDSHSNRFSGSMSGSKSQHKNKDKAFGVLRSRLYEQELAKNKLKMLQTYVSS